MESLGMNSGALPSGGSGFPVGIPFPQILGIWLEVRSPAQNGVLLSRWSLFCFLLHSPLLMLLIHSMSIIHRDILHPGSPTTNLGE